MDVSNRSEHVHLSFFLIKIENDLRLPGQMEDLQLHVAFYL
jgi:hypothetical protein